jgi:hypothetical protein
MWQEMLRLRWPELQAPLYMAYMWCWQHTFGDGEWASRMATAPWFILGGLSLVMAFDKPVQRSCALLTVVLNPFTWFYLNEARLYALQLGLTYVLVGALIRLRNVQANDSSAFEMRWVMLFCVTFWLLSALTVLGMIWAGSAILVLPFLFSRHSLSRMLTTYWRMLLVLTLSLAPCAAYYAWTRLMGTRASHGVTDWRSLCFIFFEQLGFNGLGPGRLALRDFGPSSLKPWLPTLVMYGVVLGLLLVTGVSVILRRENRRAGIAAVIALVLPMSFMMAIGFYMQFRLLGRHCTPLVAGFVLLLSLGAAALWERRSFAPRVCLLVFVLLSAASCLSQRFASRHAKDDYRAAASIGNKGLAKGCSVWWNAEPFGSEHYHLNASTDAPTRGRAWILLNPPEGFEDTTSLPDIVILSKRDIYDVKGTVRAFLERAHYVRRLALPAFTIFTPSRDTLSELFSP